MPRSKPAYPPEFKAEAVRLVGSSDRSLSRLAKGLIRNPGEVSCLPKGALAPGPSPADGRGEMVRDPYPDGSPGFRIRVADQTLRNWVRHAEIDDGVHDALAPSERE